jgi:hypothetical protein
MTPRPPVEENAMIGTKPYAKLKYREVPTLEAVANVKRRVRGSAAKREWLMMFCKFRTRDFDLPHRSFSA